MTSRLVPCVLLSLLSLSAVPAGNAGRARLAAASGQLPSTQSFQPLFRTNVDVITLDVAVSEHGNRYVHDLDAGDFSVLDDGKPQDVVFFSRGRVPMALSLLLDTSGSMAGRLTLAQQASAQFARRIGQDDLAQIVDFDNRVRAHQRGPILWIPLGERRSLQRALTHLRRLADTKASSWRHEHDLSE